ncbi:hypothetical protein R69746_07214 [Paraburkholderia aspalathi]|nr:hypothetical protein R69746_07214 [Paraburkholderia aspalathi]CAE6858169.1 hypothetical protein R75465_07518 [Paraburkholderia aspalathi]
MQEPPLFTTVRLEDLVPADHPLRPIRLLVNDALKRLNGLFSVIYADTGRASIAPEKLLRALLLQEFYSVRSERMPMEQMRYNLLFRRFVGLAIEDAVWDHSVFSKNRDRLLEHDVVEAAHQSEHEPMLKIRAGIGYLRMQLRDVPLVLSCALRLRRPLRRVSTETVIGQFLACGERGETLQAEVDANPGAHWARGHVSDLDHDIEEPVAASVTREVGPVLDATFGQGAAAEHAEGVAGQAKRFRSRPFRGTQPSAFLPR